MEIAGPVHVIVLPPESPEADERVWLSSAATNPAFDFLAEPEEHVSTLGGGHPLDAARRGRPRPVMTSRPWRRAGTAPLGRGAARLVR